MTESATTRRVVVFAVTDPATAKTFLLKHLAAARAHGWEVLLLARRGPSLSETAEVAGVEAIGVSLSRRPSIVTDCRALGEILLALKRVRPAAIHYGTPKAGLLVGLAALILRIPTRVYVLHGLRYETLRGLRRASLKALERVSCFGATDVIAVSPSLVEVAKADRLARAFKVRCLGSGSIAGVDAKAFAPDCDAARKVRTDLDLVEGQFLVTYVGRLAADKGIDDLVNAWRMRAPEIGGARLLLAGPVDETQPPTPHTLRHISSDESIVWIGHRTDVRAYYWASDVVVLPSHREGFGNCLLEASAASVPVVATRVTGCVDAVVDGSSGLLIPPGQPETLIGAISRLLSDERLRHEMGAWGRSRAEKLFPDTLIVDRYTSLLQ